MSRNESFRNIGYVKGQGRNLVSWLILGLLMFAACGRAEPAKNAVSRFYFVQINY